MKTINKIVESINLAAWLLPLLVFLPVLMVKRAMRDERINKILIVPQLKIGDLVCQTPVFREIKKTLPDVSLHVLVTTRDLESIIRCDPHVDKVIIWPAKADKFKKIKMLLKLMAANYDWSFSLAFQSWIDLLLIYSLVPNRACLLVSRPDFIFKTIYSVSHTHNILYDRGKFSTQVYLDMFSVISVRTDNCMRKLHPCPQDRQNVTELINKYELRCSEYLIGIGISCGNKLKQWPEESFAELADRLVEEYQATIVFTGSAEDKSIIENIRARMKYRASDCSGLFSLGQFAAFCEKADLFISVDSGPLYIACAVGTPVINIAGPFHLSEQFMPSAKSQFIQLDLPCVPCSFVVPSARTCRYGHRNCITGINAKQVMEKAEEILKKGAPHIL